MGWLSEGSALAVPATEPLQRVADRGIGAGRFIEILGFVVVRLRLQQSGAAPVFHSGGAHAQCLGDFVLCEEPALAEAIISRRQAVVDADPPHHHGIDGFARARAEAVLGKAPRDLHVGVVGQQAIDFGDDFRAGLARGPGGQRPREGQRLRGASTEADVDDELGAFEERDVLDDQAQEALAFSHRRCGVVPEAGDILG